MIWSSSNPSIAVVDQNGVVSAVSNGVAIITVTTDDNDLTDMCIVTVSDVPEMTVDGQSFVAVDLGLPSGTKWASYNLGANNSLDKGNVYAWGEVIPKSNPNIDYDWSSYKWSNSDGSYLIKYNTRSNLGFVDNLTSLELDDDAAHKALGGTWRMPTDDELWEIYSKCSWSWHTVDGITGKLVVGPNGNSIFLPYTSGNLGLYWSSSLNVDSYDIDSCKSAMAFRFYTNLCSPISATRCIAGAVRPVTD